MAVLISAQQIGKSFGAQTLFRDLSFGIHSGQKIGLIGPNGAGKSTLMKILAGLETPDRGSLSRSNGLRLSYMDQDPRFEGDATVWDTILSATDDPYDSDHITFASELISRLDLESSECGVDRPIRELSGGWMKRVALARALVTKPNLLLLDEPTNHLDVPSIQWIENFLDTQTELALLTITHDRLFLQNTCDFIYDLDPRNPDGLLQIEGSYADFLDLKNATMGAQKTLEETRSNQLRRETAWLRRGAKARQTKQKARIDRAHDLADEVQDLKNQNRERRVEFAMGDSIRNPKKIIEATAITKKAGDRYLFKDFNFILGARARVGLLGANGCGKTTLIRTLLGRIEPDSGTVRQADGVGFAYFEQKKESLDPKRSVLKTICPDGDYVQVQNKPVFAKSYLSRFHFRHDQMELPVEKLSGGEKTRLLLAGLLLQTEPVFILDEPTNDLDIATLDTLEEALREFQGAVILVTHDRYFMDQVCDQILGFGPDGNIEKFANLFQWEEWTRKGSKPTVSMSAPAAAPSSPAPAKGKVKLSFKEQHELDNMEKTILTEEGKLAELEKQLADPGTQSDYKKVQTASADFDAQKAKVEKLYERWTELTKKAGG